MPVKHRKLPILPEQDIKRFWGYVDKTPGQGPKGDCWEWKKGRFTSGYGAFSTNSELRVIRATRLAYFLSHNNDDPGPLQVQHSCDWPPCCRPEHLSKGTGQENMDDMVRKGRSAKGDRHISRTHPELLKRGDEHYSRTNPEKLARGDRNGSRTHPERLKRGDESPSRLHPENLPHGDDHWTRKYPEKIPRGDNSGSRKHPERLRRGDNHPARLDPSYLSRGEECHAAKLTDKAVREMRKIPVEMWDEKALAAKHGVNRRTINGVRRGVSWKHVQPD